MTRDEDNEVDGSFSTTCKKCPVCPRRMSSLTLYFNYLEYIISINLSQHVQVKNSKEYTPMSEDEIYLSFVGWLNKHWWKMPETDHLLPSFKTFFTKEEAQLLTGFPFMPTELGELAQLKKMDSGVLTEQLAALAQKGVVWKTKRGENLWFHLNDAFFIFFRGSFYSPSPGEKTIALAQPLNKYLHEGVMAQLAPAHNKPLRTVPVQRTVEDPRKILPHEDVLLLVDSQDFFALSHCACRQRKKLDPDSVSCNHPLETCIHLGKLAHYMVENELSRQVSKEEVLNCWRRPPMPAWSTPFPIGKKMPIRSVIVVVAAVYFLNLFMSTDKTRVMTIPTIG